MSKVKSLSANRGLMFLVVAAVFCVIMMNYGSAFADGLSAINGKSSVGDVATVGTGAFPWTKMLNTLAAQLTGPLPMILGVLGLAVAALAMFSGNGGAGTQKFVMLIFAVSTCLFAPTFISWVSDSASSAMIADIVGIAENMPH